MEVDTPEPVEVDTPEPVDNEPATETNNVTDATNEDDTTSKENMSFEIPEENVPDPDREDGGFEDPDYDLDPMPEKGEDLSGTDWAYDAKGNIVRRDGSDMTDEDLEDPNLNYYGDDKEIVTGITSEDLESIGQRGRDYDGKLSGHEMLGPNPNPLIEDFGQDVADTIDGRTQTTGIDADGNEVTMIESLGDADNRLLNKTVTRDTKGILGGEGSFRIRPNRRVEKSKYKSHKGNLVVNSDTGELEFKKGGIVQKEGEGFLGLQNRKQYIDGKEITPEYKKQIKEVKKQEKKDAKAEEKAKKKEEKRVHNETKHIYKGMNVNEAQKLKEEIGSKAHAAGMSYEQYIKKNFPPPPKDDSILAGGPFGTKEERQQRRKERKEREQRENYDNYYASNEPY